MRWRIAALVAVVGAGTAIAIWFNTRPQGYASPVKAVIASCHADTAHPPTTLPTTVRLPPDRAHHVAESTVTVDGPRGSAFVRWTRPGQPAKPVVAIVWPSGGGKYEVQMCDSRIDLIHG